MGRYIAPYIPLTHSLFGSPTTPLTSRLYFVLHMVLYSWFFIYFYSGYRFSRLCSCWILRPAVAIVSRDCIYIFGCDLILGYQVRCWVHGLGGGARCIAIIKLDYMFVAISSISRFRFLTLVSLRIYQTTITTHIPIYLIIATLTAQNRVLFFIKRCWCA